MQSNGIERSNHTFHLFSYHATTVRFQSLYYTTRKMNIRGQSRFSIIKTEMVQTRQSNRIRIENVLIIIFLHIFYYYDSNSLWN